MAQRERITFRDREQRATAVSALEEFHKWLQSNHLTRRRGLSPARAREHLRDQNVVDLLWRSDHKRYSRAVEMLL